MTAFDPEVFIDIQSRVLGLDITAEQRPGVATFLTLAAEMATLLETADLGDDTLDLDGVFSPVVP
jgi:hypothetical protein